MQSSIPEILFGNGSWDAGALWVRFEPETNNEWIGIFTGGVTGFKNQKILFPNPQTILVLFNGAIYILDQQGRELFELEMNDAWTDLLFLKERGLFCAVSDFEITFFDLEIELARIRIPFTSEMVVTSYDAELLHGKYSDGLDWRPFRIDLATLKLLL